MRVVPVERLSEAAAELKALRARHLFHDHLAQAMVAGAAAGRARRLRLVGAAAAADPDDLPAGRRRRARSRALSGLLHPGRRLLSDPARARGPRPQHPGRRDARLAGAGRRSRRTAPGLAGWFAPEQYYVAQVMVSERSRAKVIVPQLAGTDVVTIPPGGVWEWGWQLNDQDREQRPRAAGPGARSRSIPMPCAPR